MSLLSKRAFILFAREIPFEDLQPTRCTVATLHSIYSFPIEDEPIDGYIEYTGRYRSIIVGNKRIYFYSGDPITEEFLQLLDNAFQKLSSDLEYQIQLNVDLASKADRMEKRLEEALGLNGKKERHSM